MNPKARNTEFWIWLGALTAIVLWAVVIIVTKSAAS